MPVRFYKHSVPPHRCCRKHGLCTVVGVESACFFGGAGDDLEGVAMKMEGVLSRVVVIENDFDDLILGEDEGVGVVAVDQGVCCVGAGGESCVESRDFGSDVCDVVEEGVVCAVVEVVHFHIQGDRLVDAGVDRFFVVKDQSEVVELGVERVNQVGLGFRLAVVVNEPSGDIWV